MRHVAGNCILLNDQQMAMLAVSKRSQFLVLVYEKNYLLLTSLLIYMVGLSISSSMSSSKQHDAHILNNGLILSNT